ncbi:MAG TPA: TAT-variant-translocated molybdopterin oxidoreductase [Armatimonadaceae bacterium]|nr:TAT-variant-translocated molybdopterin oxidoreductase [Armatimonadaceae bacterium]
MHSDSEQSPNNGPALARLSARLEGKRGKQLWRSLEEIAETPEFQEWVDDEFPNRSSLLGMDRRRFLTLGGAALALAGLSGCRILPNTKAVPFVRSPEDLVTGRPLAFATALPRNGYAVGVVAKSYEGRPVKIEGNPRHPASLGATDVFEQAEILSLYDPDRAQGITDRGEYATWDQFVDALRPRLKEQRAKQGAGLRVLSGTVTSPTLAAQRADVLAKFPAARWHHYDPVNRDSVRAGAVTAFGRPVNTVYRLQNARVIVSLDADFLHSHPGNLRLAREFADGRRIRGGAGAREMNRLYVVESATTITGASADHRWPVKPSEVEVVARALHGRLVGGGGAGAASNPVGWFEAMVEDLEANRGRCVVIPGEQSSPAVHAYAHAINEALGSVGQTVVHTEWLEAGEEAHADSLRDLAEAMNAGRVDMLLILGGNPVYNAPADVDFAGALSKVRLKIRQGLYQDETSALSDWHIPGTHPLETWSDLRAFDGTVSVVQPLIAPLYDGRSEHELIAEIQDLPRPGLDIVQSHWRERGPAGASFDRWWQTILHDGLIPGSALPPLAVTVAAGNVAALPAPTTPAGGEKVVELNFRPDQTIWDGRYANNSWLQELPKPVTTLTWDAAAILSPLTAREIGVVATDGASDAENAAQASGKAVISLKVGERTLKMPVLIQPGHPNGVVTVPLGFGRTAAGRVGTQDVAEGQAYAGWFNAYLLRTLAAPDFVTGVEAGTTGEAYRLSTTQAHHLMRGTDINEHDNRDIVRFTSFDEYVEKGGKVGPESSHHGGGAGGDEHGGGESGHGAVDGHAAAGAPGSAAGDNVSADAHAQKDQEGLQTHPTGPEDTGKFGKDIVADWNREEWSYTDKSLVDKENLPSFYPEFSSKGFNAWAMSIDLTTCIGCNACVAACQAENNIPTVGKEQVGRGREMHWLRIDHYFSANAADPAGLEKPEQVDSYFMPVPCMQCEKAPCEPVCPVAATIHSHEGLNQMVYNRCIGTRYCSNNCPYKVRRFNFLKWTAGKGGSRTLNFDLPVLKLAANPDVTVRGRGVMEKCTYCVQRINVARIEAKKEEREIRDGEVVTACQQACPTRTIIFGDLNNPNSEVSKLKREPHDYALLAELNTRPRTTYLARVTNPNPKIKVAASAPSSGGHAAADEHAAG